MVQIIAATITHSKERSLWLAEHPKSLTGLLQRNYLRRWILPCRCNSCGLAGIWKTRKVCWCQWIFTSLRSCWGFPLRATQPFRGILQPLILRLEDGHAGWYLTRRPATASLGRVSFSGWTIESAPRINKVLVVPTLFSFLKSVLE